MNEMNPNAITLMIFGYSLGAYFGQEMLGLAIASGLVVFASLRK